MNPVLTLSRAALAAITGNLIVAYSGDGVITATGPTDPLAGVADSMGASAAGNMLDVVKVGLGEVRAGGTITAGDPLTSDAAGKAVKAVPVAGSLIRLIGFAEVDAEDGDIFEFDVAPGVLNTPA